MESYFNLDEFICDSGGFDSPNGRPCRTACACVVMLRKWHCRPRIHRRGPSALVSQTPAMHISDSGPADWTRCSPTKDEDNGDPSFIQPRELYQLTPPYPRVRLHNFPNSSQKGGKCRNLVSGKIATLSITATPLIIPTHSTIPTRSTMCVT